MTTLSAPGLLRDTLPGTFGVVLVQLVGRLLPVLDAVLKGSDEALHQSTAFGKREREMGRIDRQA